MDLRQMEYAVAIADELNFTRAAARCRIGQSGLSHQITQLEREVGARLFERTSRSVRVTQAGQTFVACARRVLQAVQEMQAEIASLDGPVRGRLRIGSLTLTAGKIDHLGLLREYQEAYPAVEVMLSDADGVEATTQLLTGELEVAVIALHEHQLPPGIAYHLLRLTPLVAVVGRRHRLRGTGVVDLGELADERFLECSPDTGLRMQVDAAFDRARARRRSVCALRSAGDLASLALEGIGVTLVPDRWPTRSSPATTPTASCASTTRRRSSRWPSLIATLLRPHRPRRRSCVSRSPACPGREHLDWRRCRVRPCPASGDELPSRPSNGARGDSVP